MIRTLIALVVLVPACERVETPQEKTVEVEAMPASLAGKDVSIPLTDETLAELRGHPEVASATPRMLLQVSAIVRFEYEGREIVFPTGGFVDGIEPRYVDDPAFGYGDGPLPVLVSPSLLDIYNQRFAPVYGQPVIGDAELFFLGQKPRITAQIAGETIEVKVIGISPRAMRVGVSVPIDRVRAWNNGSDHYSSIVVVLKDGRRVRAFETWLAERGLRLVTPW